MSRKTAKWKFSKLGSKNGTKKAEKVVSKPQSKWYPADRVRRPLKSRKGNHKPTRLKAGLVPGAVVIVLSGRFKGKRAVFLKQLDSGLILVTGPYKINGVPLRRLNQAYVIVTSTVVDVSGVDVSKVDDAFFAREKKDESKKAEFFKKDNEQKTIPDARKQAQKDVDTTILANIKKVPYLKQYLNAKFSLRKGQYPHEMKF